MDSIRKASFPLLIVVLAAVVALGCGGDDKSSGSKNGDKGGGSLGLDSKVACTVDGEDVESKEVEELAESYGTLLEEGTGLSDEVDPDELSIDDWDGDAEPLEAVAANTLVNHQIVASRLEEDDVEIDEDDVEDATDSAIEANGVEDEDELFEQLEESGLEQDLVERWIEWAVGVQTLYDELDEEDAEEFDDALEYGLSLREDAKVKCAKELDWSADFEPVVEAEEGDDVNLDEHVNELLFEGTGAEGDSGDEESEEEEPAEDTPVETVDPQEIADSYDARAYRQLSSEGRVLLRFVQVANKLSKGTISIKSTVGGFKRQAATAKNIHKLAKQLRVDDPYIMKTHKNFVTACKELQLALEAMASLGNATTSAQIDSRVNKALKHLNNWKKFITRWEKGLKNDPQGRTYPQISAQAAKLVRLANQL
jgi:hypothetical protein